MTDTSLEQRLHRIFHLVANKEPIPEVSLDDVLWRKHMLDPVRSLKHRGRVLASAVVIIAIIVGVTTAIVYGPRNSVVTGHGDIGESSHVKMAWAAPVPAGYVSEQTQGGSLPTGVQALRNVAKTGVENGNATALRKAGWVSGIALN